MRLFQTTEIGLVPALYLVVIGIVIKARDIYDVSIEQVVNVTQCVESEAASDACPVVIRSADVVELVVSTIDDVNSKAIPGSQNIPEGTNLLQLKSTDGESMEATLRVILSTEGPAAEYLHRLACVRDRSTIRNPF